MKSLRMRKDRTLYFKELPPPGPPGPQEVLVKMRYASICGYDLMMLAGAAAFPQDGMMGHEGAGTVVSVGSQVQPTDLSPGDPVTIDPYAKCGKCDSCRSDRPQYCADPTGHADLMTEYLVLPQTNLYRLPEAVSLMAGSLIEPLMMAMHTVEKARLGIGSSVLLIGCGAMGQIILKLARTHPVGKIVVVEPVASKREAALRFGADVVLDPSAGNMLAEALLLTEGRGFDAVIEASGSRAAAHLAPNMVARGGSVVYFGLYGMNYNLELNLFNLYWKDASISCVCVPSGRFPAALALAPRLHLEEVITGVFPFAQALAAFQEKLGGQHAKVTLEFPSDSVQ